MHCILFLVRYKEFIFQLKNRKTIGLRKPKNEAAKEILFIYSEKKTKDIYWDVGKVQVAVITVTQHVSQVKLLKF